MRSKKCCCMTRVVLVHSMLIDLNIRNNLMLLLVTILRTFFDILPCLEQYGFFWESSQRKRLKQEVSSQPVLLDDYNYIFGQLHLLYFASKLQENILSKIILKDSLLSLLCWANYFRTESWAPIQDCNVETSRVRDIIIGLTRYKCFGFLAR